MAQSGIPKNKIDLRSILNITVLSALGQVGCFTIVVVLGAAFGGLYLDNRFNTKPALTILLLLISIPVSILSTLAIVRSAAKKMNLEMKGPNPNQQEEERNLGGN